MRNLILTTIFALLSFCANAQTVQNFPITPYPIFGSSGYATQQYSSAAFGGSQSLVTTGSDGFMRIVSNQFDSTGADYEYLVFTHCLNAGCTSYNSNQVYTTNLQTGVSNGCIILSQFGDNVATVVLDSNGYARIIFTGLQQNGNPLQPNCSYLTTDPNAQNSAIAVGYIQCNDVNCASSTYNYIGQNADGDIGITMASNGTTADVLWGNWGTSDGLIGFLDEITCSGTCSGQTQLIDYGDVNCENISSPHIASDGTLRFAYWDYDCNDSGAGTIYYYSNGTSTSIASNGTTGNTEGNIWKNIDMALNTSSYGIVAWPSDITGDTEILECTNASCSTNVTSAITENFIATDDTTTFGYIPAGVSVNVLSTGFPRILRSGVVPGGTYPPIGYDYIYCLNASCSSYVLDVLATSQNLSPLIQGLATSGSTTYAIGSITSPSADTWTQDNQWSYIVLLDAFPDSSQPPPKYISRTISNVDSDSPSLQIPVLSKAGKEPFSYNLVEAPVAFVANGTWQLPTQMVGVPSPPLVLYTPTYPAVAPTTRLPAYSQPVNDSYAPAVSAITTGTPVSAEGWFFVDPTYVSHFFGVTGSVSTAVVAPDGYGYSITAGAANITYPICATLPCPTVTDASGNIIVVANNTSPTFNGIVAEFADLSEVIMKATFLGDTGQTVNYTDTLGVIALTAAQTNASSVPPSGTLPTNTYSYTNSQGTKETFTVTYGKFTQQTDFGCTGISDIPATAVFLPIKVSLPDGSFYTITYETTPTEAQPIVTGRLASVTLPTGATISYAYSGTNNGMNCADGSVPTLTVTTPDGVTTYVHAL